MHHILEEDLLGGYRRWVRQLGDLERTEREIADVSGEFRDFAVEKLFWVRSSRMTDIATLRAIPEGLNWCWGPHRWLEVAKILTRVPVAFTLFAGVLLVSWYAFRRRVTARLTATGIEIRRVSTDRFALTLSALFATFLLALPGPVATAVVGYGIVLVSGQAEWSYLFGMGLLRFAATFFVINFLVVSCRPGGLGEAHFGWNGPMLRRIRHLAFWLLPVLFFAGITLDFVVGESTVTHLNNAGRLAGAVLVMGSGTIFALMFHPHRGVAATMHEISPRSLFGRLRWFWFLLIVGISLFQTALLIAGYVITVLSLTTQVERSLYAVLIAFLAYGLLLR